MHVLQLEESHRNTKILHSKPKIAIGLETALDGTQLDATDFHGQDGLGNVHNTAPHFSAPTHWINQFNQDSDMNLSSSSSSLPFVASKTPSYLEIINILRTEPENTVTIVAIGPLMNLAKAAEIDPYVFSRAKSVVSMGGALRVPGNVTPYSEFNVFSDPLAASRVYNLTGTLDRSPQNKSLPITLDILPLDLTEKHKMFAQDFDKVQEFHSTNPSPLFQWASIWLKQTFNTYKHISGLDDSPQHLATLGIQMHDPLAVHYALTSHLIVDNNNVVTGLWRVHKNKDVRIETNGTWTRGMTVEDRRGKPKRKDPTHNDYDEWLTEGHGNNIGVVGEYLGIRNFGQDVLSIMFGLPDNFF